MHEVETVRNLENGGYNVDLLRRVAVPGGWIYLRSAGRNDTFVPDPTAEHVTKFAKPTDEALRNEYNRGRTDIMLEVVEYLKNNQYTSTLVDFVRYFSNKALNQEKR